jgi:hypothetical protein
MKEGAGNEPGPLNITTAKQSVAASVAPDGGGATDLAALAYGGAR